MADTLNHKIIDDNQTQILEIHLSPHKTFIADAFNLLYLDEEILIETKTDIDLMEEKDSHSGHQYESNEPEDDADDEIREKTMLEKAFHWVFRKKETAEEEEGEEENDHGNEHEEEPENEARYHITYFSNESDYVRIVAFSSLQAGKIIKIDLNDLDENSVIIRKGTFVCANDCIEIEPAESTDYGNNYDFEIEKLSGQGFVFLRASGKITEKRLDDDSIQVNLNAIVAYEPSIELELYKAHTFSSLYNDHKLVLTALKGTGKIWLQSGYLQNISTKTSSDDEYEYENEERDSHKPEIFDEEHDF